MFDVSFSELVLILIVGLLVFGPEKLPDVVRTAGLWLSKLRRTFNHIRTEIEREVGMEELKRDIHNQGIMDSLQDVHNDLRKTQQELGQLPYDMQNTIAHNAETDIATHTASDASAIAPPIAAPVSAAVDTAHAAEREHNHRPS